MNAILSMPDSIMQVRQADIFPSEEASPKRRCGSEDQFLFTVKHPLRSCITGQSQHAPEIWRLAYGLIEI